MKKILMVLLMSSVSFLMGTSHEVFSEDFEGTFPPADWTLQTVGMGFTQTNARPHTGSYSMVHTYSSSVNDDWVITPLISVPLADSVKVSFWENENWSGYSKLHRFCVSTNMADWDTLYTDISPEDVYTQITLSLDAYTGQDIYMGWYYSGYDGDEWYIDDVVVTGYGDFTDISAGLDDMGNGSVAWGDYDNDGDLDILSVGYTGSGYVSKIYRNDSGIFTDINAGLEGVTYGYADWGDYDNDGDLDILLTGYDTSNHETTKIYCNNNGVFTAINAGLINIRNSSVAWGDYDNDGDLDILLTGSHYENSAWDYISKIYRNDSGVFTDIDAGLPGVMDGSVAWGDYDNDGDLDILLTGYIDSYISKIYRNDSGVFTDINAGLSGVRDGSVAWGDYDNDGDLDIVLTGYNGSYMSKIYRNDAGVFTDINAGLTDVSRSSVAWGDYDNDGDLDILLAGYNSSYMSKIYRNDAGVFTDIYAVLTDVSTSSVAWGDYDNDGDLDILLTGYTGSRYVSKIYRNNTYNINNSPIKPSRLICEIENEVLELSWDSSTDNQTPSIALSYNVELQINGQITTPGMSDTGNGYRKVAQSGNASENTFYKINNFYNLPQEEKALSYKVQAIDHSFAGSEFASSIEYEFVSPRDLLLSSNNEMVETDKLKWEYIYPASVDYYIVQVDDDPNFGSPLEETVPLSKTLYIGIALNELSQFGSLVNNTTYYWRMKPIYTGINRFTIFSKTPASFIYHPTTGGSLPTAPVAGFNPANDEVTDSSPTISWGNATDPDGHAEDLTYTIELDSVNTFSSVLFTDTTDAGETFTQVSPVLDGGYRFYYRVKTIDADLGESTWSATQQFITLMPPSSVKITDDGANVNLTWDEMPLNTKGVVYTVYSSEDPYAEFPAGWTAVGFQLPTNLWSEPHGDVKKFYRVTVGSSSK